MENFLHAAAIRIAKIPSPSIQQVMGKRPELNALKRIVPAILWKENPKEGKSFMAVATFLNAHSLHGINPQIKNARTAVPTFFLKKQPKSRALFYPAIQKGVGTRKRSKDSTPKGRGLKIK